MINVKDLCPHGCVWPVPGLLDAPTPRHRLVSSGCRIHRLGWRSSMSDKTRTNWTNFCRRTLVVPMVRGRRRGQPVWLWGVRTRGGAYMQVPHTRGAVRGSRGSMHARLSRSCGLGVFGVPRLLSSIQHGTGDTCRRRRREFRNGWCRGSGVKSVSRFVLRSGSGVVCFESEFGVFGGEGLAGVAAHFVRASAVAVAAGVGHLLAFHGAGCPHLSVGQESKTRLLKCLFLNGSYMGR